MRVSAKASLFVDGKFIKESKDDVIFQSYGLTGTAILDLSNEISYGLADGKDIWVCLDLLVDYSEKKLAEIIKNLGEKIKTRPSKKL